MNFYKLLSRLRQGAFYGNRTNKLNRPWFMSSNETKEGEHNHAVVHEMKRSLIRNSSRGEGIGMGHRNKKSAAK